jgi:intracellular sulfur oxidation DsrE/DsrF family protein
VDVQAQPLTTNESTQRTYARRRSNRIPPHRGGGGSEEQDLALTLTENLANDETIDMDDVAVLAQGEGIDPVRADGEKSDRVESLINDGVTFKACSNTLEMFDLDKSDLVAGIETQYLTKLAS